MGGMEEEDRQTKGGRIFSRQTYIYGVGFVETGWERRRWVRSIYRQTSLRDGVCRNNGRDGGGGSTIKAISASDDLSMGGDCRNGRQGGGGT